MRLAKFLAHSGVASRRAAERLVASGRVTVGDAAVTDPAHDVDESSAVAVDGRPVAAEPHEIYRNRPWLFWQFTTTGYVSGIEKPVDRNVFNGTPADWRQVLPQRAPKSARTD